MSDPAKLLPEDTGACRRHAAQQDISCSCLCIVQFVLRSTSTQLCFAELLNIVSFHNDRHERSAQSFVKYVNKCISQQVPSSVPSM